MWHIVFCLIFGRENFYSRKTNTAENHNQNSKTEEQVESEMFVSISVYLSNLRKFHFATMRLFIIAVFSFTVAVFKVRGSKFTNTSPVDSAKTGGQTILCNHYAGEDPEASEAFKKTGREARSDCQTQTR